MNIGILGTKLGMTQIFDESGLAIPVTIIKAGPCTVTQIKTKEIHGYNAIQIGYKEINQNKLTRSQLGHLKINSIEALKYLKEIKIKSPENIKIGNSLAVDTFKIGSKVNISGKTIGKGFAGTVKRHNFTRGPMTHGSKNHREPGSIGQGTTPGRVYPGKRMAGRLGGSNRSVKNLQIMYMNLESNLLVIKGAVPGKIGNLLFINSTDK